MCYLSLPSKAQSNDVCGKIWNSSVPYAENQQSNTLDPASQIVVHSKPLQRRTWCCENNLNDGLPCSPCKHSLVLSTILFPRKPSRVSSGWTLKNSSNFGLFIKTPIALSEEQYSNDVGTSWEPKTTVSKMSPIWLAIPNRLSSPWTLWWENNQNLTVAEKELLFPKSFQVWRSLLAKPPKF